MCREETAQSSIGLKKSIKEKEVKRKRLRNEERSWRQDRRKNKQGRTKEAE